MNNKYDRDMEKTANVKLLLLQSGEQVVADVEERIEGDLITLKEPRGIVLQSTKDDGDNVTSTISHGEWFPLSKEREISISLSYVVAIVEPLESLHNSYLEYLGQDNG